MTAQQRGVGGGRLERPYSSLARHHGRHRQGDQSNVRPDIKHRRLAATGFHARRESPIMVAAPARQVGKGKFSRQLERAVRADGLRYGNARKMAAPSPIVPAEHDPQRSHAGQQPMPKLSHHSEQRFASLARRDIRRSASIGQFLSSLVLGAPVDAGSISHSEGHVFRTLRAPLQLSYRNTDPI